MIDALTARERMPGGIQISDVTKRAFNLEAFQCFVVFLVSQQRPDSNAVVEQSAHEIGAHMPGRTGDENGRRR